MWGRLSTCGRLSIGLGKVSENFHGRRYSLYVTTFHVRRLPHIHAAGRPMFLTWRLHGTLPAGRYFPSELTSGGAFVVMDRLLDEARTGPLSLRIPRIATLLVDAIHHRAGPMGHFDLHAYVVMPNHVHLLVTPLVPVSKLTQSLKRFTAREANRVLNLTGSRFWQDESYDRLVRDDTEFRQIAKYIEWNPVKAGLVARPEDFPWSSARPIANRPQVGNLPHSERNSI